MFIIPQLSVLPWRHNHRGRGASVSTSIPCFPSLCRQPAQNCNGFLFSFFSHSRQGHLVVILLTSAVILMHLLMPLLAFSSLIHRTIHNYYINICQALLCVGICKQPVYNKDRCTGRLFWLFILKICTVTLKGCSFCNKILCSLNKTVGLPQSSFWRKLIRPVSYCIRPTWIAQDQTCKYCTLHTTHARCVQCFSTPGFRESVYPL